jgi:hypothetical protein
MIQKLFRAKSFDTVMKGNSVKEDKQAGHDTEAVWSQVNLYNIMKGKQKGHRREKPVRIQKFSEGKTVCSESKQLRQRQIKKRSIPFSMQKLPRAKPSCVLLPI